MGVYLSSRKIAQLQEASSILLAPFSFENGDEWRIAVCAAIERVVDASGSMFGLATANEQIMMGDPGIVKAMAPYVPPIGYLRDGYLKAFHEPGRRVFNWTDAYDPKVIKKTEFYNECVLPNGLLAPIMLSAQLSDSSLGAAVFSFFDSEANGDAHFAERRAFLELLVPSFEAGVGGYVAAKRQREKLISFGELSNVPLTLLTLRGTVIHESRALEKLLSRDPEGQRVRTETLKLSANLSGIVSARDPLAYGTRPIKSRLTTRIGAYEISAFSFENVFGHSTIVGVLVSELNSPRLDGERLALKYGLTKREVQTAAMLQRRMAAKEIATALGVSVNTARRHTEHVLSKLGVHTKHEAAERLNGDGD